MRFSPVMQGWYRKSGSVLVLIALLMLALPVRADVLVSPQRVSLDDDKRSATVILRNPSAGPRTYRLEWIEQRMSEDGVYSAYKEGEEQKHASASPYLRLSPRQITVQPNSNQSIRVEFKPGKEMKPGEYRSHLIFRVVEELSEPVSVQKIVGEGDNKGMTLMVSMQMSVAIPVVVRHQVTETPQVKIASVEVVPATEPEQPLQLAVLMESKGLVGCIGRVSVDMQRNAGAAVERIGSADNISIFAEVGKRLLVVNLRDSSIPAGAWVRVAYEGIDEYAGILWDEKVFQVK
ncbi:MAG: hypothetical protein U1B30_02660 [Pseudomonadota bacterium]|nr:hypothetical protein [Pseudomonadota bacterium]